MPHSEPRPAKMMTAVQLLDLLPRGSETLNMGDSVTAGLVNTATHAACHPDCSGWSEMRHMEPRASSTSSRHRNTRPREAW